MTFSRTLGVTAYFHHATPPPGDSLVQHAPQGKWGIDGTILFTPNGLTPLSLVPASGGQVTVAVQLEKWRTNQLAPRFLPSRRQFLFVLTGADPSVWLGSPDGAATGRITLMQVGADSAAEYLPPGWLVRVRQNVLEAQRFDVSGGKLSGYPVPLGCWNASDKHSNCGLQCPERQQHHAACQ